MIFDAILVIVLVLVAQGQSRRISVLEQKVKDLTSSITSHKSIDNPIFNSELQPQSTPIRTVELERQATAASMPTTAMPSSLHKDEEPKPKEENSGKILGRIGIAAVLVGVAFFLKYAFDNNWIGPIGRVIVGIIFGIVFLSLGQYLRKKYLSYSNLLMGGGIVILYLSLFAAHSFYNLIDPFMTYVLMFLVTTLGFIMSIINEDKTISFVSVIGGFLTPFMIPSSGDVMVSIFTYITILNIGVLGVSFFKKWPNITAIALVGTAINFLAWYGVNYNQSLLSPTILFLTFSFLIFLIVGVARILIVKEKAGEGDYFVIAVNALMYGIMLYVILNPSYSGVLGFVAVLIAIIYGVFAIIVNKINPCDKALNIFLPGLTVVFLSVAVPLQLSGPWIATAWLVESCVLYYIASTMSNRGFQIMGIIVYILGLINLFFWNLNYGAGPTFRPVFNSTFFIFIVAIVAAYTISYFYKKYGSTNIEIQKNGIIFFVVIANILTIVALSLQITGYYKASETNLNQKYIQSIQEGQQYNRGQLNQNQNQNFKTQESLQNTSNISVSILWAIYAAILTAIGFASLIPLVRKIGLILFVITAVKIIFDVWDLGELYRIVSFIVFGIIALVASFAYVKYKDRLVNKN